MMSEQDWNGLVARHPDLVRQAHETILNVAAGRLTWAQALGVPDAEMLNMAKLGAARMDQKRLAEAERMFQALTDMDPYIAWFWLALGDACSKQGKLQPAIAAYSRCIDEARMTDPVPDELRVASFRRAELHVRCDNLASAIEDFRTVLHLDTPAASEGERAWLALQTLADEGRIGRDVLESMPRPR